MNGAAERSWEGDPIRGRARALAPLLVVLSLVLGGLSGCVLLRDDPPGASAPTSAAPPPPGVIEDLKRVLRRRAVAVREDRARQFRAGLAAGDPAFRRAQSAYFTSVRQLPLGVFRYSFDPADILRVEGSYWVVVRVHLQLEGYDAAPVVSRDRYLFSPDTRGRLRLASVTDAAWEARNGVLAQPWDRGPVQVRSVAGVLGVFDAGSVEQADDLLTSVQRGIADVSAVVPYTWEHRVVVYALSDTGFMASLRELPGGDPDAVDAVAFPVPLDDADPLAATAGVRVALHPRMLAREDAARDRLVRHELTHVALGERDDDVPTWLSEGIAEWVSVTPLAPQDRALSTASLVAAREGLETGDLDLPASEVFNGSTSGANYGLSWWACEHLVSSYGEAVLWDLVDALGDRADDRADDGAAQGADEGAGQGTDERGGEVLRRLTGLRTADLAQAAARRMVATYGP